MRILLFPFLFFFIAGLACLAEEKPQPSWQTVRDKQPAGMRLTMALPKTHFHLGEVITATLTFSSESKEASRLSGPSDGRTPDRRRSKKSSPPSSRRQLTCRRMTRSSAGNRSTLRPT